MGALEKLGSAARLVDLIDRLREKRKEHTTEQLIFLEELIRVEALQISQLTQLHRLRHDRSVRRDFFSRVLDVIGNAIDQKRNMVQEFLSWKNTLAFDRHARGDPLEPARGQVGAR